MKALWAAAIALAGATSASATVYTYEYQGLPVLCGGPEGLVPEHGCGLLDSPEGWSGAIGIDETMLPGGTLANANIRITAGEAHPISGYGSSRVSGYHVEQGNRIFEGRGLDGLADVGFVTTLDGYFGVLDDFVALESFLEISFDENKMIRDWDSFFGVGGDPDFSISREHGDTYAYYEFGVDPFSGAAGTWTRVSPAPEAPAPVPLPAGAWALAAGGLALGGLRLRRGRRAAAA